MGGDREDAALGVGEVSEAAVVEEGAFWLAGRAGGIDDIGEVVRGSGVGWGVSRLLVDRGSVAVEAEDTCMEGRELGEEVGLGKEEGCLGVVEHKSEAVWGIAGVEG